MTRRSDGPTITLTRRQLFERVWTKPLSTVARDVGLSSNALAKICDRLLVPYPPRGYWTKGIRNKRRGRPPLPAAPEAQTHRITISPVRSHSRRARTRMTPSARRKQLIDVAEALIEKGGLGAATMKQIAAAAGISETQVYNYFSSRTTLLAELAQREFSKIRELRSASLAEAKDHDSRLVLETRAYLRQIGQRGALLQTLISNSEVRSMLRKEHRRQHSSDLRAHAQKLAESYGLSWQVAIGCTVVLWTVCLRAGKVIADGRLSADAAERICLSMVLHGSRNIVNIDRDAFR